jgi:hypothetical protein
MKLSFSEYLMDSQKMVEQCMMVHHFLASPLLHADIEITLSNRHTNGSYLNDSLSSLCFLPCPRPLPFRALDRQGAQ